MKFRYVIVGAILCLAFQKGHAQVKTYDLKKGQAFDILFLNTNPDSKETLDKYFSEVIPIGQRNGYRPQRGFKIKQVPLQGNYWPTIMVVGLWEDYQKREAFVTEIVEEVPDFHERRRKIWTSFNLTYWEVEEDKTVQVDGEKFNVVTAYWGDGSDAFTEFNQKWTNQVDEIGGEIILTLTDGTSPFGYRYNPDHLTITSWDSKEDFETFYSKNLEMDHASVVHVNQFIIE